MRLHLPDAAWRQSYLDGQREKVADGRLPPSELDSMILDFERYLDWLRGRARGEVPEGRVPETMYWMIADDTYVGRISLRHRLTPDLEELGGHIGYEVRAGYRQRGHATSALAQVLPHARALGLDRVLVTCDVTNPGSIGAIERNGGVLQDEIQVDDRPALTRRYWIDLTRSM